MDFLIGFACGVALCLGVALLLQARRLRRAALPPATRRQIDRDARARRAELRIVGSNARMLSVDELDNEETR